MFDHLFFFSFGLFLLPIFLFPRSAPAWDKRNVVLVACYACASDGQWAAFAGKEKNILSFQGKSFLRGRHQLVLLTSEV
ncbi:hypothetical protein BREVNS_1269 [Brevinematales bacterium NS]|nr:hypothetical protein BREVNS_1269 [Brevinematales bacterium NS]